MQFERNLISGHIQTLHIYTSITHINFNMNVSKQKQKKKIQLKKIKTVNHICNKIHTLTFGQ